MDSMSRHILIWSTCMQATGMWALLHLSSAPVWTTQTLGLPLAYAAIFPAIAGGTAAIGSAFSAKCIARLGTDRSLLLCLVALVLGIGLQSAGLRYLAVIGAGITGFAYALTNPVASALLAEVRSKRTHLVFSIKQSGVPLGAGIAVLCGPLAEISTLLWVGIPSGILVLLLLTRPSLHLNPQFDSKAGLIGVWRDKEISRLLMMAMCFGAVQMIVLGSFPSLLETGFIAAAGASIALALGNSMGLFGRIFWGGLADRLHSGPLILTLIGFTSAVLILTLLYLPSLALVVFALTGFVAIGWNGVFLAAIRLSQHQAASTVTASAMTYLFASGLIGQVIFSVFLDQSGPKAALLAAAAIAMIGGLFGLNLLRLQRHRAVHY
jgi:predicted MFS family arabinose efflux permease